jgi:thiosulfate reductase cytochrome b subunit
MKIVEKHSLWLRIHHWLNVPLIFLMIWSGLLIYWANDVYSFFFPQWFYSTFNLDSRLAEGMAVHFTIGWLFIINGFLYLIYVFTSGHWRELLPGRPIVNAKFNALQRLAYTGVIFLAVIAVLSGFAIYKPVQLGWLANWFGGYEGARLVHFIAMISFCIFILIHLIQVARAGWNNFRAMVAGFEVEDERE